MIIKYIIYKIVLKYNSNTALPKYLKIWKNIKIEKLKKPRVSNKSLKNLGIP